MEPMNIWELKEYAKKYGYNSGRFLCVNEKGIFEMKWLDAYYGFISVLQPEPKEKGFITVKMLIKEFGENQKYIPTIGYENYSK